MAENMEGIRGGFRETNPWVILVVFLVLVALVSFIILFIFRVVGTDTQISSSVLIKVSTLAEGSHSETLRIENFENFPLLYAATINGFDNVLSLSEVAFELAPSESKDLSLLFDNLGGVTPGVYTGSVILDTGLEIMEIPIILEVESIESDIAGTIDLVSGSRLVRGDDAILGIQLYDSYGSSTDESTIRYGILDFSGNILIEESETISFREKAVITRFLKIDKSIDAGDYVVYMVFGKNGTFTPNSFVASVQNKQFFSAFGENQIYFLVLLIIFFVFFLIFVLYNENSQEEVIRKLSMQYKEELGSQVSYLKLKQKQSESSLKTEAEKERNRRYFEDLIKKAKVQASSVQEIRVKEIEKIASSDVDDKAKIMKDKLARWDKEGYKLPSSLKGELFK
ncbi:hypothetical protein HN747_03370 [archaeon]|jgi:hypothetical protein|nr:hypothetical protein [archaeon]